MKIDPLTELPLELLTVEEMGRADRLTIERGTPGMDLMEQAGFSVARALMEVLDPGHVTVLCGPGNNGGDGFIAARELQEAGWTVRLGLLGDIDALKGDAAEAARRWDGPVEAATPSMVVGTDAVIDALFGAGLTRVLDRGARQIVRAVNDSGAYVVSVDIPSGVHGTTGQILGLEDFDVDEVSIRADNTITFFRAKPGHTLFPGRGRIGRLEVADIGISETVLGDIRPLAMVNDPALWADEVPSLEDSGHKYARGHALAVSGGMTHTGAARLAAMGALRVGAGLVTVASPGEALMVNAAHLTAIMLERCDGPEDLAGLLSTRKRNAVVLGPALGVGEKTRALVRAALETCANVVLDADALTSFAEAERETLFTLTKDRAVLTPHTGEFERLFPGVLAQTGSKLEAARTAAREAGCVVVIKGADTVIAQPDGLAAINCFAPPNLATAGSGDVLAGIICGLTAQGMSHWHAACAGVWLHGEAARMFGDGLIAEDLPDLLPRVWDRLDADLDTLEDLED